MTVDTDAKQSAIVKQLEYYLGDFNLIRDKFFQGEIAKNNGWISLETMLSCKRLLAITQDKEEIVQAIQNDSRPAEEVLLEVDEEKQNLRRKADRPVPTCTMEELLRQYDDNHVYVKGFARDAKLDEIQSYVERAGPTLSIHLRNYKSGESHVFKGSVNVVFAKKEDAEKFLQSDEFALHKGKNMIRLTNKAHLKEKEEEKRASINEKQKRQEKIKNELNESIKHRMVAGAILEITSSDPDKKLFAEFVEEPEKEEKTTEEKNEENKATEDRSRKRPALSANAYKLKGVVANVKQKVAEVVKNNELNVAWVDVEPEKSRAVIRFKELEGASKAWAVMTKETGDFSLEPEGVKLSGRVLAGEEELECWKTVIQNRAASSSGRRGNFRGPPNKRGRR